MSNIEKYNQPQTPAVYTAQETAIMQAQNSPTILSLQKNEIKAQINGYLMKAFTDAGISINGQTSSDKERTILILSDSVADDLIQYFKTLTIQEIGLAVQNGIRGEYGEFYGINVKTIHQFCKAFRDSFERNETMRKMKQETEPDEQRLSQAEIDKIMVPACLKAFENYKATGELIDFGGAKFVYLKSLGLISLTPERQTEIMEQAKKEQAEESNRAIFKSGADSMAGIIAGKILKNLDKHETVKNAARLIALREYFDYLIEFEIDLSEQMNKS